MFLTPVEAFDEDSFSQLAGEEYLFKMSGADPDRPFQWISLQTSEELKITIVLRNYSEIEGIQYDTLWSRLYKKAVGSSEWLPYNPNMTIVGTFNSSNIGRNETFYFIPHNEQATNATLQALMRQHNFEHINWTSGVHGYDGTLLAYNGTVFGEVNKTKIELTYSETGALKILKLYLGTGGTWRQVEYLSFQEPEPNLDWIWFVLIGVLFVYPLIYPALKRRAKKIEGIEQGTKKSYN